MKDETKSSPSAPVGSADDALARAFEELLQGPLPHQGPAPAAGGAGSCPAPDGWARLASGEARPAETDTLLSHAAACAGCAARLRQGLRLFSEEPSAEEIDETAKLASASADWQRQMAVELARTPHKPARPRAQRNYVWAGVGLAAMLTLAVGLSLWWQQQHTPERLLAEAYTRSRSFDLRMPGAGFAAVTPEMHLRGRGGSRKPASLIDARTAIEHHLESAPEDPHWLQLEARADVMEERFDPAIEVLGRLLAAGPVTSSLLVDNAAAYFERGTATGSENDRAMALDSLRRADELAPGDPVVLFNEAIAMEDRGQVINAVETWNRYLRFERDPRWLAEGRRRLETLEQKLNQMKTHQGRIEQLPAPPETMRAPGAGPAHG